MFKTTKKQETRKILIEFRDGKIDREDAMERLGLTTFGSLVSLMYSEKIFMKINPSYLES